MDKILKDESDEKIGNSKFGGGGWQEMSIIFFYLVIIK